MSDPSSLRNLLRKIDMSAPAIQAAAGAMMKHYDKSAKVAVVEWRNALHQAKRQQHLPLLYVANEVLQNSKRNRGNKFLEAFSPVIGQALIFLSQTNQDTPSVVEKIRRTVKIWADRHVLSVRFVNELLKGLDPYRNGGSLPDQPRPSPKTDKPTFDIDKELAMDDEEEESEEAQDDTEDHDDDDDDDDLFADTAPSLLKIDVDLDRAAASAAKTGSSTQATKNPRKRRRSSITPTSKATRRRSILSTNSLVELWNSVATLQQKYDHVQALLSDITPEVLNDSSISEQIDSGALVGDELLQQYKQTTQFEHRVVDQRLELHSIAQKRRIAEVDAIRYLPWLEAQLQQDQDDWQFSHQLLQQLQNFQPIYKAAKAMRQERLAEEKRVQQEKEAAQIKQAEEEERRQFMESVMSRNTEAKPGMVWNRSAGEYQYPNTEESWRD